MTRPPSPRGARRRRGAHRKPPRYSFRQFLAVLVLVTLGVVVWRSGAIGSVFGSDEPVARGGPPGGEEKGLERTAGRPTGRSASPTPVRTPGPINTGFPGLTTFRGNATRSYYGEGPLPADPQILWRYPASGGMCSVSTNLGTTKTWCGMGWTGQPNVIQRPDGTVEVRFGAYDSRYHFLDGKTGRPLRPDLVTGDLAKGSATSDPDGFPLYYAGSRDNYLRIVALDRPKPTVLWSLNADTSVPDPVWNDDWDGAPLVIGDYLLEGGENSWFYVIKLNRRYDKAKLVQVDPKVVLRVPGYDDQLFDDVGDQDVSIESSIAFSDGVAYFANSGGLVQGWDISGVLKGGARAKRVFRFWTGDDTDATVVIDSEGYLYVGRHGERSTQRDRALGDLIKLDPRRPKDPVVWSVQTEGGSAEGGGIWGTPALYRGVVYVTTNLGEVMAVSKATGNVLHTIQLAGPTWASPVAIDDRLLVGDCNGVLHNFDISHPRLPPKELWSVQLEGCIEATPAVWRGKVYVGTRGGAIYGVGDAG